MRTCAALVLFVALSAAPPAAVAADADDTVRFLAFGDGGFGRPATQAVSRAMAQVCAARGCDFALMLGDNFYPSGVTRADDPQFETKFEQTYALLPVPVYAVLGNHDNGVNGDGAHNQRGQFQVEYHYRRDRSSEKWRMPARYYQLAAPLDRPEGAPPLAEFFALDSNPFAAYRMDPDPAWDYLRYGPGHLAWFKTVLAASRARWKIAFAHHTYVSNGVHGDAGHYPARGSPTARGWPWKAFVDRSVCARKDVDLVFQGHDHDLQWIKPLPHCGKTQFFVSGAAGGPSPITRRNVETYWQQGRAYGFFWIELRRDEMTGAAYTLNPTDARPHPFSLPLDAQGRPQAAFEQRLPRME